MGNAPPGVPVHEPIRSQTLDYVELLQLSTDPGDQVDFDDSGGSGGPLFDPSQILHGEQRRVCRGMVIANSRFKVVRTSPKGVFGEFVPGRTKVRVVCSMSVVDVAPAGRCIDRVLFAPLGFRVVLEDDHVEEEEDSFVRQRIVQRNGRVMTEEACFESLQRLNRQVALSGGRLHVRQGESVFSGEDGVVFVVKACEPSSGFISPASELHFDTTVVKTVDVLRAVPVAESVRPNLSEETLQASLREYLDTCSPVYITPGSSLWVPVFSKYVVEGSEMERRKSIEEIRAARVSYFENRAKGVECVTTRTEPDDVEICEMDIIEWKVLDSQPLCGGTASVSGTDIRCEKDPMERSEIQDFVSSQQNQVDESDDSGDMDQGQYSGQQRDRCLRCGGLVEPPSTRPECPIYRCPCGQSVTNSSSPVWLSLDGEARRDDTMSERPSVRFLQELREVINVMPTADPRTPVIHSSLNVFPRTIGGGIDFEQADRLVLLIMPSLRGTRGVDRQVLERLPTCVYLNVQASAEKRNETSCCICMDEYRPEDLLRTLPCFHFFHKSCIDQWLDVARSCPMCKYEVE
mmetsp:Transcript_4687/g.7036  ORF Transcript_4687/g.7036 Transcript_4687/m.7036 type:complete len:575 (+) Transcript_4687:935-2659(+)